MLIEETTPYWACRLCKRKCSFSEGCDDIFPHLCDGCWMRVSMAPEAVAYRKRIKEAKP